MYESVRPMCISETGVDKTKVDALEATERIDDIGVFCYAGCIMNKLDIVRSFPTSYFDQKNIFIFIILFKKISYFNSMYLQIDDKGRIKKYQVWDLYRQLNGSNLNAKAKFVVAALLKDLQKTNGLCDAGRAAVKFIQTIFNFPEHK